VTAFVRAILWVLFIVAPGGVFLLPLLIGDAVARRKREEMSRGLGQSVAMAPSGDSQLNQASASCSR
jgi:hypothetical protein